MKRGRKVFFCDVYCELDCKSEGKITLVVASRLKAKKVIQYVRHPML
jgi:hypothetical protein